MRHYTAGRGRLNVEHMLEVLAGVGTSAPGEIEALARAVLEARAQLTSCILVLVAWDGPRRRLAVGPVEADIGHLLGGEAHLLLGASAEAERDVGDAGREARQQTGMDLAVHEHQAHLGRRGGKNSFGQHVGRRAGSGGKPSAASMTIAESIPYRHGKAASGDKVDL